MITELAPHQIFVFGSNLAGQHAGGAARQARESFGAEEGVGEGLTGQCYAFPTLDSKFRRLSDDSLKRAVARLYETAIAHPDLEYLLTRVGCGIAGYEEDHIRSLFADAPSNVSKPHGW